MRKLIVAFAAGLSLVAIGGCTQPAPNSNAGESTDANTTADVASVPDLKGKWVGTGESIVRGNAIHHEPASGDQPLLDNVEFTMAIDGQDGHRFWGTVSSAKGSEPLTGVVGWDGKTIHARSKEGIVNGTVDGDTIELVYSQASPATVVAVNRYTRQK
jgi:hypothetical protein